MVFTKEQALDAAHDVLTTARVAEGGRLDRIHRALRTDTRPGEWAPTVQIPADAPPLMKELARKAETNHLPLLVKTFAQVIKVDGYYSATDDGATEPWAWWERNRMGARQTGLIRSALSYGAAYATVLPGTYGRGLPGPAVSLYSPREMTAAYADPEADEWPILAVGVDGMHVTLFDETHVYRFGIEPRAQGVIAPAYSMPYGVGHLTFIGAEEHGLGVCPVVRFRDRNLLAGEEQYGIVEPLLTMRERITESTFQALVTDYFQAFKQRYLIGWVPESEEQELKSGRGTMWYLEDDPTKITVGSLDEGSVNLDMRNAAIRDFAAMGQIPVQALGLDGISNISAEALAGLESAKNREAGEICTSLGESVEQMLRLCAYIDGNQAAADDYASETRWADLEARSYAQTIDGLGKLVTMLGLPPEVALEDVPGMTEQKLKRAKEAMTKQRGATVLAALNGATGDPNAAA